jgi:hypothetical protein
MTTYIAVRERNMPNLPGTSTTAIGSTIHKLCENDACGRIFDTHEPSRKYCSLKCKDFAARRRRLKNEKLARREHNPRAGELERDNLREHMEAAATDKSKHEKNPLADFDLRVKLLYNAVVNEGKMDLLNAAHIPTEIKQAVNKMLAQRNSAVTSGEPVVNSWIVEEPGKESVTDVLKDLGFTSGEELETTPTEDRPAAEYENINRKRTDKERAEDL